MIVGNDGFVAILADGRFAGEGRPFDDLVGFAGQRQLSAAGLAALRAPWPAMRAHVFGEPPAPTSRPK